MGEANDELMVSTILSYRGIMKETQRGSEPDFFMGKTICLSYEVTQEGFSFLLGKGWKMENFRFGSVYTWNN